MTSGTRPLEPGATVATRAFNVFLAAYDSAGYFLWSRSFPWNEPCP